jgi:replication fork clamp-binding protein CrfC
LPGLTRIPVGDQPPDVEKRIRKLVLQYVSKPNCIILAVTPANTDLATSDALNLAREVDADGERTIGVLTKVDLVEEGSNITDILEGRVYPLRQGYVGVVCRPQKDLTKSIQQGLQFEETFFRTRPEYRNCQGRVSIPNLAKMLNRSLMYHIRDALPDLKARLSRAIHEHESELNGYGDPLMDVAVNMLPYGDPLLEQKSNQGAIVLHLFNKFARNFADAVDGKVGCTEQSEYLTGGARIHHIFHDIFSKSVQEFDALSGLSDR